MPPFPADVDQFNVTIQRPNPVTASFDSLWQQTFAAGHDLLPGQAAYGRDHRRRFQELFNAVAHLIDQVGPDARLLEFGVSQFSGWYRQFFPQLEYHVADRPVADGHPGFTRERSLAVSGCARYFEVDLEQPDRVRQQMETADVFAPYDVVVFTEVLEHLVADAAEVVGAVLDLVRPGGYLYLTTPNFFSMRNRQALKEGRNPEAFFPSREANWDAHHHHREYSITELLDIVRASGSELAAFVLSDCWDLPDPGRSASRATWSASSGDADRHATSPASL